MSVEMSLVPIWRHQPQLVMLLICLIDPMLRNSTVQYHFRYIFLREGLSYAIDLI